MIRATCECGKAYELADSLAGRKARCGVCNRSFLVSSPGATVRSGPAENLPPPADLPTDESKRFGPYVLFEKLGEGGMGVVHKAWDTENTRWVALKTVRATSEGETEDQVARFMREAEAIQDLRHPNIIRIREVGQLQGRHYIAIDYVTGGDMAARIGKSGNRAVLLAALADIADAVGFAHQKGILHRDLKPTNILYTSSGTPMLTDFGLAKRMADSSGDPTLTQTGQILGTPMYMAPEQISNTKHGVGPLTDVYALGVIAYEIVAGKRPFTGSTVGEVFADVLKGAVPRLKAEAAGLPPELNEVILRAMSRTTNRRPASAAEFARQLRAGLAGQETVRAAPPTARKVVPAAPRTPAPAKRAPLKWAIAAGALGVIILAIALMNGNEPTPEPPIEAPLLALGMVLRGAAEYRVDAREGIEYRFETRSESATETSLQLYDPSGTLVESGASPIDWTCASTGTYRLAVTAPGTFMIAMLEPPEEPPPVVPDEEPPVALTPGRDAEGALAEGGGEHRYGFDAQAGERYWIDVLPLEMETVFANLRDANGGFLDMSQSLGEHVAATIDWTCRESGPVVLTVQAPSGEPAGRYVLRVERVPRRDPAVPSARSVVPLTPGAVTPGRPGAGEGQAWFRFTAHPSTTYRLIAHGGESMHLVNASWDLMQSANAGEAGPGLWMDWTSSVAGVYRVMVQVPDGSTPDMELQLNPTTPAPFVPPTPLTVGQAMAGEIAQPETEVTYGWVAEAGRAYRLAVHRGTLGDAVMRLETERGDIVAVVADIEDGFVWACPEEGAYRVIVRGGSPEMTGTYEVGVMNEEHAAPLVRPGDDVGDTAELAGMLAPRGVTSGVIDVPEDVDVYQFYLPAGADLRFRIGGPEMPEAHVAVSGPEGEPVELQVGRDDREPDVQLFDVHAEAGGRHFLYITGGGATGTYSILLEPGPRDRPEGDLPGTVLLEPGRSEAGEITREAPEARYRFTARAGRRYVIEAHPGTLGGPDLLLGTAGGDELARGDDSSGRGSRIEWDCREAATYLVSVMDTRGGTGSFTITLAEMGQAGPPQPSPDETRPEPVEITRFTVRLRTGGGGISRRFTAERGHRYRVEVELGGSARVDIMIESGDREWRVRPGGTWRCDDGGRYTITVGGEAPQGSVSAEVRLLDLDPEPE